MTESIKPTDYYAQTRPEMAAFVPLLARRIIDVGCGEGRFAAALKIARDAEVWGIELNEAATMNIKTSLDKVLIGDMTLIAAELPKAYFDCITLNDVLEHLPDPYSFLTALKSNLTQDGVLVCSIPNVRYLYVLFDLLVRKQWKYTDSGVLDRTHLRFFTKRSIYEMFNELGFEVLRLEGLHGLKSWKFRLLNALSLGLLADTCFPQFACVARPR